MKRIDKMKCSAVVDRALAVHEMLEWRTDRRNLSALVKKKYVQAGLGLRSLRPYQP